ncbi:MAG: phosphatidylinositol transfer protein [Myxococcales bacterium]|nr:phosphatidylinositol transfer protein [Myxococcales bacterium]
MLAPLLALFVLVGAGPACPPVPDCRGVLPPAGQRLGWRHWRSKLVARLGDANHRGRDLLLVEGEPQWAVGKFAYGLVDKDLKDETVDVYALQGCQGRWRHLGEGITTKSGGKHAAVDGYPDTGGVLYFEIPEAQRLPLGLHRLRLVVRGDGTGADAWIRVLPKGTPVVVSDIDGTLTTSPHAETKALLRGRWPGARPGANTALQAIAAKGYPLYYLSSRPDWLAPRSHGWLRANRFPAGIIHTSLDAAGELKAEPATLKIAALERLKARGLVPVLAFGDQPTDAQAFAQAGVPARWLVGLDGPLHGGQRFTDWREPLPAIEALPPACGL